jgi:hypothetical protein
VNTPFRPGQHERLIEEAINVATRARTGQPTEDMTEARVLHVISRPEGIIISASETDSKQRGVEIRIHIPFRALASMVALMASRIADDNG